MRFYQMVTGGEDID